MSVELDGFVDDFAAAICAVDSRRPVALNQRSKSPFQPGIGPHSEAATIEFVMRDLASQKPPDYGRYALSVPYASMPRQRCDLCLGAPPSWDWVIEVKLLRFLGDNGNANDNMLMHLLSPYPEHRSALTDCSKLLTSGLDGRKAVLVYGFESEAWPLALAIDAFETLAQSRAQLGARYAARFDGLVHPVHSSGAVFAWEIAVAS
jgi:hypothetical protein